MNETIKRLRAERSAEIAAAKTVTEVANQEGRELSEEESAKVKAHVERSKELAAEIAAAEQKERDRLALLKELDAEAQQAATPQTPLVRPDLGTAPTRIVQTGGEGSGKFRSFGEYLHLVRQAATRPEVAGELTQRINAASGLQTAVDSEGGFLIPPTYLAEVLQKMYTRGEILSRCRRIPLSGNTLKVPYVNESSRADGSRHGGVRAYWLEEGGTPTATKTDYGQLSLRTKKCMCLGYVTEEQMEDYGATGNLLLEAFADEMLFAVENAIFQGTGAGQPLGVLNAPCAVSVSAETNQTAATIWGPNVVKMWAQCWPRSRQNAVWLANPSAEPYLWGLTLEGRYGSASTSAEGVPIYFPAGTIANQGNYPVLMGRPVIICEYTKAVGTAGDIVLADFSQYLVADKGGMQSAESIHVRFAYDERTFRTTYRVDGAPWWASALTPYDGGNTLSPFVKLATRS